MSDEARARDYQPGQVVPDTKYKVIRLIGVGGMGAVYDVEDTSIGKRYVLKTLHPQLGSREDLARRMHQEARTLARLQHPNIVEVITAGVTGDDLKLPYIVMERLEGHSLRLVLQKKGQLELGHAYHIAIDLLEALDHAHDKGVIHRDVKPDNIFLSRTMTGMTVTKLLDFGIVSLLGNQNRETAGRFLGTLRYAAPEQLTGGKATPKTDIYSAGLVLFEMVAGRGPFDEFGDSQEIARAHVHLPAPPLSNFVVVPKELERLVRTALAKDPDDRLRDAFSFMTSLKNLKKALEPRQPHALGSAATAPVSTSPPTSSPPLTLKVSEGPITVPHAPGPPEMPTLRDAVDRMAPTNTGFADTPRMAHHGTEGYAPPAHVRTLPSAADSIRWPSEQPPAQSEDPQVRNVVVPGPSDRRGVLTAVFTVVAMLALSGTLIGLLLMRHQRAREADSHDVPASAAATPSTPPPAPSASQLQPLASAAPSEAPAPIATAIPTATPTATPTPTIPTPTATPTPTPTQRPTPTPKPVATTKPAPPPAQPAAPDRPGPGF